MPPLSGRGALVTGVSRRAGIGHAIAARLEELGAAVFRHGWSAYDDAQPWGAEPRVEHLEADLAEPDAPAEVMAAARRELGHVDILVGNHARSGHGRLGELTAEELDGFSSPSTCARRCSS
jgi:3-oxoacyl-[acyl-carrier protein] reductase